MRAKEALVARQKRDRKSEEERNSRFEYIFRDGLFVTSLSHGVAIAAGEVGIL